MSDVKIQQFTPAGDGLTMKPCDGGGWIRVKDHEDAIAAKPSYVRKVLDISTAHLSPTTATHLQDVVDMELDFPVPIYDKRAVGFMVYVPPDPAEGMGGNAEMPADLLTVLMYARSMHCDWVMFDRDGTVIEDLPEYEWE